MCHYLQSPLAGAPSCSSNRVCQFINPSCSRRMLFVSPWTMNPDSQSQSVLRDNQGFFFPHPTSAHCSPLPAKFKYVTQHCDISDELCVSLCVSLVCLSCSCQFHSLCFPNMFFFFFYTVQLQSYLKASDFNTTIKSFVMCLFGDLI